MQTLSELLKERSIEEPKVLSYKAQFGGPESVLRFLSEASGVKAEIYADDFCEFARGEERLATTAFLLIDKSSCYMLTFYGKPFAELSRTLGSVFESRFADLTLGQWCANYAMLRRMEAREPFSEWTERLRPWWNRLKIEGDDPDLTRELALGFDDCNLAKCMEKVANPREYEELFEAIADNAALHYSPRTLYKYLEKLGKSELAFDLYNAINAPGRI